MQVDGQQAHCGAEQRSGAAQQQQRYARVGGSGCAAMCGPTWHPNPWGQDQTSEGGAVATTANAELATKGGHVGVGRETKAWTEKSQPR